MAQSPKFVVCLRDPFERFISHYLLQVRGGGYEDRAISDIIKMGREETIVARSCYYSQLKPFIERFPREAFHFVLFEELVAQPKKQLDCEIAFFGS
ncbi:sulfotransferase [Algiphilus sp. NNCM1]|uniref:sulfotransferase domain-containing protein n=1 Tax=Algiphilus sp. TaxID=1872431 RepID=UPI001CA71000|nr:sulfotransferase [Algiphilus acroporae]